jgi:hypothetical protein
MKKRLSGGPRSGAQNGPKNVGFSLQITAFSEQTGFPKMDPKITKIMKNVPPERTRFGPQNGPKNVGFSLQITAFSKQAGFPKMNPKITKILKNVPPGTLRFEPQNGPQNVDFSLQKTTFRSKRGSQKCTRKSANTLIPSGAHTTPFGRSIRNTSSHASKEAGFRD